MQNKHFYHYIEEIQKSLNQIEGDILRQFSHGANKPSNADLVKIGREFSQVKNLLILLNQTFERTQKPHLLDNVPAWGINDQD